MYDGQSTADIINTVLCCDCTASEAIEVEQQLFKKLTEERDTLLEQLNKVPKLVGDQNGRLARERDLYREQIATLTAEVMDKDFIKGEAEAWEAEAGKLEVRLEELRCENIKLKTLNTKTHVSLKQAGAEVEQLTKELKMTQWTNSLLGDWVKNIKDERDLYSEALQWIADSGISGKHYQSHSSLVKLAQKTLKEI